MSGNQPSDLIIKCKYLAFFQKVCMMCFSNIQKNIPNNYPEHNPPKEKIITQDRDLEYISGDLKNALYFLKEVVFI